MPFKTAQNFLWSAASLFILSGCGWLSEDVSSGSYTRWESAAPATTISAAAPAVMPTPAPPSTRVMQAAQGTWLEPEQGARPVPTPAEVAALNQANARIAELEQEVASLRNDMSMMMPALTKLADIPASVESATDTLNNIQPAAGHVEGGEIPRVHRNFLQGDEFGDNAEMAVAAPQEPPSAAQGMIPGVPVAVPDTPVGGAAAYTPPDIHVAAVKNVRFGNHENGRSRMVIDVSAASDFAFDIDNKEKLMVIEIPGTVWDAGPLTRHLQDHPLVQSMASSPDGRGGTRVVLQLKAPVKILWSQAIPPAGGQGDRLVFDMASL